MEDSFEGFRPEFGPLLIKSRIRRPVNIHVKKIRQFIFGSGRTFRSQECQEFVSGEFFMTRKILIRMNREV